MIELDACKQLWREQPASASVHPISKEELVSMLQGKTLEVRGRALDRVRGEAYTYIAIVLALVAINLTRFGAPLKALASTLAMVALLGMVVAALFYKQHQLRTLPLGGNLQQSLVKLISTLDSATRLYMAAYMACMVIGLGVAQGLLFWRYGVSALTLISLSAAVAFLAWSYRSGQAYLQRMFGHYRAELLECLRELQTA